MAAEPPTRHRRPTAREGEGGRRLHSAGAAIAVSFGAVLVSLLLNAPGLHKSAQIQPEGWKRDVALAVTEPLESVSGALLLDQPRRGIKAALGRSEDDDIDTEVGEAPTPAPGRPSKPAPPPKRERFTPDHPLRLWVAGDSLVVVPGESVLRAASSSRSARSRAGSRPASSGPTSSTGSRACATSRASDGRARSSSCSAATTTTAS